MRCNDRLRRRVAWLALCAVLFGAAAPSVSRWLAATRPGQTWVEVCSVGGTKRIALDDGESKAPAGDAGGEHCPYCRLQSDLPVALLPTHEVVLAATRGESVAWAATPALRPRTVWAAHRSRAPPARS
jgi:hypothetical protein